MNRPTRGESISDPTRFLNRTENISPSAGLFLDILTPRAFVQAFLTEYSYTNCRLKGREFRPLRWKPRGIRCFIRQLVLLYHNLCASHGGRPVSHLAQGLASIVIIHKHGRKSTIRAVCCLHTLGLLPYFLIFAMTPVSSHFPLKLGEPHSLMRQHGHVLLIRTFSRTRPPKVDSLESIGCHIPPLTCAHNRHSRPTAPVPWPEFRRPDR